MRWLKVVFGSMVLAAWPTVIGAGAHWPFGTTAPPDQTFAAYVPRVELREAETAQIVGRMGGTTRALAVTGDRVYAGIGDQLVVFDVSDTHSVLKVGETVALGATVIDLAADGDTVFVAAGAAGLQVFDVSDPSGPRRRAILGLPGSAHGVALCGRHVCVGADEFGLVVVDVMDLDRLRPLGRLRGIGAVRALAAVGSHVFLAQGANALRVVDVGIPSDPHQIGYLADGTPDGTARDIAVAGGHAFVIGDSEGVRIIDIGDPTLPTEAAYVSVGSTSSAVTILGGHAFLADLELGLQVLDITDPAAARLVGEHAVEGGLGAVTAASSRIYAGSGRVNLVAYDAVDPTTPRELARYAPPSGTASVAVGDEHAYVVVDQPEMGLAVVTASPGVPTRLAGFLRLDIEGLRADAVGIGASGRTAYLLYHQAFYQAMQAVDARIPDMPQVTRLLAVPDATAMAVAGDYLYIAGDGLRVVDISQPRNPRQVGYSFKAGMVKRWPPKVATPTLPSGPCTKAGQSACGSSTYPTRQRRRRLGRWPISGTPRTWRPVPATCTRSTRGSAYGCSTRATQDGSARLARTLARASPDGWTWRAAASSWSRRPTTTDVPEGGWAVTACT